ncbi:MAG: hypothetical protein WCD21_12735 [Streptomyces sp.]
MRGVACQAINGLILHLPDPDVLDQAERTFTVASDVHRASDAADLDAKSDTARASLRVFIRQASASVR